MDAQLQPARADSSLSSSQAASPAKAHSLKNQTIWLTGATSGIGKALAKRLAEQGNFVIVSGRRKEALDELVAQYPGCMHAIPMDVGDSLMLDVIREQLQTVTDSLDTLVMVAGTVEYEDDLSLNSGMYERVFDTNFMGVVNTVSIALPLLKNAQQKAHIVGISSLSVLVGFPRAQAYGASKAAMEYFLNSLRADLSPRKFDVTISRPGFVATPMTAKNDFDMPFQITVDEAVDHILRGMSRKKRQFSFPWQLSAMLKVFSWMPGVWYRFIAPKISRHY